jgi:hypothetical protein
MPKFVDALKREAWQRRLERFEAGDLSVAQFCRDENVGMHTFYYWSKQLGRKSSRHVRSPKRSGHRPKPCVAAEPVKNDLSPSEPASARTLASVVHFTWDSRLSFSVPAECLDAIRCVLEYANRAGSPNALPAAQAFRQLIAR